MLIALSLNHNCYGKYIFKSIVCESPYYKVLMNCNEMLMKQIGVVLSCDFCYNVQTVAII